MLKKRGDLKNEVARCMFFDKGGALFDEAGEPYRHAADGGIRKVQRGVGLLEKGACGISAENAGIGRNDDPV